MKKIGLLVLAATLMLVGLIVVLVGIRLTYSSVRNAVLGDLKYSYTPNTVEQALLLINERQNQLNPENKLVLRNQIQIFDPIPRAYEAAWSLKMTKGENYILIALYDSYRAIDNFYWVDPVWIPTPNGWVAYGHVGEVNLQANKNKEGKVTITIME